MKIELKSFKFFDSMSEETTAFTATLYSNGKKVGTVKNDGHGGENYMVHPYDKDKFQKVVEYCASLPPDDYRGHPLPMDFDLFISNMVENLRMQSFCKNKTAVTMKDTPWKIEIFPVAYGPGIKKQLEHQFGDKLGEIINDRFPVGS